MATIEEIIQRAANPFDPVTFKTGNFWQEENQAATATVASIHQGVIDAITQFLLQVAQDHRTRTILLAGDPGTGKSYVLKRLKQQLNDKAFFVYLPPFIDNDHLWRHTLRQTVDSLMQKPEGQQESQLLLWLKSLSVFENPGLFQKLLGQRTAFINSLKQAYPTGIYQAKEFFGVLYNLTVADRYFSACNWLRGDDLDEEELRDLALKQSVDSEAAAQGLLANLGKISTSTYPIVLCFDQIESKLLPDGSADIQPVFNINTTFHNEGFKNFLILISLVTNTWKQNGHRIQQSDRDRVEKAIVLKPITLDQAAALWESRLLPLHQQAEPRPESTLYPLNRSILEQKYAGGKTTPRLALTLGEELFRSHKLLGQALFTSPVGPADLPPQNTPPAAATAPPVSTPSRSRLTTGQTPSASRRAKTQTERATGLPPVDEIAAFKLLWEQELRKTEQKVVRIAQFSSPELISMLSRTLAAFQVKEIRPKLLSSKIYASYSCSYRDKKRQQKVGLVWAETSNMKSFFHMMDDCRKETEKGVCQALYLIRAEKTGKAPNQGHKLYQKLFVDTPRNQHIQPDLESVHHLATYDRLVNAVHAEELVVAGQTLTIGDLEALIRQSGVMQGCCLLQDLGIIPAVSVSTAKTLDREKAFLLNFVKTHHLIARKVVVQNLFSLFPKLKDDQIQTLIQDLCQEHQIDILDETAPLEEQIICLVPVKPSG
ncbi:hypothetical protein BST81_07010 [Leptolyngbya sp. 'hensonii']|uniref:AAA family ATPase n=1 Tax=Leptolyngbya sp. 'hensonii' TaxID=1922337 RepID=UPI00094FADDD|nr:AAA family ATPase [Leptolyngbya sp. 'hensonii']OLP19134.1 hypothetical protein BST81_07010 [Leptolyngbya sp. 'hensonii']